MYKSLRILDATPTAQAIHRHRRERPKKCGLLVVLDGVEKPPCGTITPTYLSAVLPPMHTTRCPLPPRPSEPPCDFEKFGQNDDLQKII